MRYTPLCSMLSIQMQETMPIGNLHSCEQGHFTLMNVGYMGNGCLLLQLMRYISPFETMDTQQNGVRSSRAMDSIHITYCDWFGLKHIHYCVISM